MNAQEIRAQAREVMTVKRVFGEPYEKDGVTVIPVANVSGGAWGGRDDENGEDSGGGGFGVRARAAGCTSSRRMTCSRSRRSTSIGSSWTARSWQSLP